MKQLGALIFASVCTLAAWTSSAGEPSSVRVALNIEPQPVRAALKAFSDQAGVQVLLRVDNISVDGLVAPKLEGEWTTQAALERLLKDTGLKYEFVNERTVRISAAGKETLPTSAVRNANADMQLAQADSSDVEAQGKVDRSTGGDSEANPETLEEIVVTGTHIRGESTASPIHTFSREDIQRTGVATAEQFIQTLPQNFNGGAVASASHNIRGGEGSDRNFAQGTGINLRGLGNDGTLVLLNGHRLAPAGVGNFVDVSGIPLAALDRIEVLTDGASAVYGSDAIAGVVNFITRKDYQGAETALRYGSVSEGSHHDWQVDQTFGGQWGSGSALASASYYDRSRLDAAARFPEADTVDFDLISPEQRVGVVGVLTQQLSDDVDLSTDASYSRHKIKSSYFSAEDGGSDVWDSDVVQYGATAGLDFGISNSWRGGATGAFNRNQTKMDYLFITEPLYHTLFDSKATVAAFDLTADGTMLELAAGSAKLATGMQYRHESYASSGDSLPTQSKLSRNVYAGYAEMYIPFFSERNAAKGVQRLDVTLAGRYEHYSDFGHSFDPKIGLMWSPLGGIALRGTYGTSFRAPTFAQLDDNTFAPAAMTFIDASSPTGRSDVILIQGNNAGLTAESARTWTAGIDLSSNAVPDARLSLTYFSIDFKDRIAIPIPFSVIFGQDFLSSPAYSFRVTHDPDLAAVTALFDHPSFSDFSHDFAGGAVPSDIVAIVDDRLGNVTRRKEDGLDLTLQYAHEAGVGRISAQIAASYLLNFEDKVAPTFPFVALFNSVSNPVDLRIRSSLNWTRGILGTTVFLNYTDGYHDVRPDIAGRVSSWTTVDLTFSIDTKDSVGMEALRNTRLSLSAQNLFDRDPPFAVSLTRNGIDYDSTNASPLGRFLSVQLSKEW